MLDSGAAVGSEASKPVRIGLLGRGTVGAAFAELLAARAGAVEAATGRRPEIAGVLTRSDGDFGAILEGSDLIVELMGGTDPARSYVLDALRAGRPVVTANKQLLAQHGDELFAVARDAGVQLRFEAAVAGVIPIVRVIQESFGVTEISKVFGIVNGTTNFILSEMAASGAGYEEVLAQAQELGYAEADPSDDVSGADAAAKMAILARLAFHTPVTLAEVTYEGVEAIQPDDLAYAKELGLSLKLLGVAERRDGGISVRVFPCFLYSGHPLAPIEGAFNAVMVEAPAISEVTLSGPGAGGVETASAVLGDLVSVLAGEAPVHETRVELPLVADVTSSFYLHLEVADRPGVLARLATVLGDHDVSVKSVVQRGMGADARLVMVVHECLESRFAEALEALAGLDELRSPPRSIRVIEEEY
jgi:homoserine dehydrogenase